MLQQLKPQLFLWYHPLSVQLKECSGFTPELARLLETSLIQLFSFSCIFPPLSISLSCLRKMNFYGVFGRPILFSNCFTYFYISSWLTDATSEHVIKIYTFFLFLYITIEYSLHQKAEIFSQKRNSLINS